MRSHAKPKLDGKVDDGHALRVLRSHPIFDDAEREHAAKRDLERAQHCAAIEAILHQRAEELAVLSAAEVAAGEELRRAEAALAAAQRRDADARNTRYRSHAAFDVQIDAHRRALRSTYHESIDAFVDELGKLLDETAKIAITSTVHEGRANLFTNRKRQKESTNRDSIQRRRDAILAALEAARRMMLDAVQTDVPMRLEVLRSGLPEVEAETSDWFEKGPFFEPKPERDRWSEGKTIGAED